MKANGVKAAHTMRLAETELPQHGAFYDLLIFYQ